MARTRIPLLADRAAAVAVYFRRRLASPGDASVIEGDSATAGGELEVAAATKGDARRAEAMDTWLTKWVSPATRDRCLRAVRQAERRESRGRTPRQDVPEKAWVKLRGLAESVGVSPQAALEGLVDFVCAEPARENAARRFLALRVQLAASAPRRKPKKLK